MKTFQIKSLACELTKIAEKLDAIAYDVENPDTREDAVRELELIARQQINPIVDYIKGMVYELRREVRS